MRAVSSGGPHSAATLLAAEVAVSTVAASTRRASQHLLTALTPPLLTDLTVVALSSVLRASNSSLDPCCSPVCLSPRRGTVNLCQTLVNAPSSSDGYSLQGCSSNLHIHADPHALVFPFLAPDCWFTVEVNQYSDSLAIGLMSTILMLIGQRCQRIALLSPQP